MSGGSLDYVYRKVEEAADSMPRTPLHQAFADHLRLVAQALHDTEWVMSCDYGKGYEEAAIRAVLSNGVVLTHCIENARAALKELNEELLIAMKAPTQQG